MKRHDGDLIDIVAGLVIIPLAIWIVTSGLILIGG